MWHVELEMNSDCAASWHAMEMLSMGVDKKIGIDIFLYREFSHISSN